MGSIQKISYKAEGVGEIAPLAEHVAHGFSWGPGSKNMSFGHGDEREVQAAEREFFAQSGISAKKGLVVMAPEHGTRIVEVFSDSEPRKAVDCDCLITTDKHVALVVRPGDCLIAIVTARRDRPGRPLALIHAGRKGLDQNLIGKSIKYIVDRFSIDPKDLVVGTAPCITSRNYSVRKMSDLEHPETWKGYVEERNGAFYLDLIGLVHKQFVDAGIREDSFAQYELDTYDAALRKEAFSHRLSQIDPSVKNGRFIVAAELD